MYGSMLWIIESNKQIRANTNKLPEQIHLENISCYYESQHTHGKERKERIEALETLFIPFFMIMFITLGHITKRINMYHKTNRRYHDKHHHTDWCETETDFKGQKLCKLKPGKIKNSNRRIQTCCSISSNGEEILISRIHRHGKNRSEDGGTNGESYFFFHLHTEKPKNQK